MYMAGLPGHNRFLLPRYIQDCQERPMEASLLGLTADCQLCQYMKVAHMHPFFGSGSTNARDLLVCATYVHPGASLTTRAASSHVYKQLLCDAADAQG